MVCILLFEFTSVKGWPFLYPRDLLNYDLTSFNKCLSQDMGSTLQASSIVELRFPNVSSNSQPEFPVISFPIRPILDNLFFQLTTSIDIPRGRYDQFANLRPFPNEARSFISCRECVFSTPWSDAAFEKQMM